jgi:hypothetical protein
MVSLRGAGAAWSGISDLGCNTPPPETHRDHEAGYRRDAAQPRMAWIRARIWSPVAAASGGPPQARRSSAWIVPCGWPVR